MKRLVIGLTLLASISSFATDVLSVASTSPVYGKECTIFIDMKVNFSKASGLNTFGGSGSVAELESTKIIEELIAKRGYTIVEQKEDAEFFLETSNGVQCVILEDDASDFDYRFTELFGTDYYLSGRFSGDGIKNSFTKTIGGTYKKHKLNKQIKSILNYCQKKY